MITLFQINFRREAFRRERAEARRRVFGLGIWLAYFGGLAILLGLYGLNYAELNERTRQLQRQIARQRALHPGGEQWVASADEAAAVEPWVSDVGGWRDLLARLPRLLPGGSRLTSIQYNPDDITGGDRKLMLYGVIGVDGHSDPMAAVTDFVGVVARDSLFAARFKSVRLVSTRTNDRGEDAEFQVECR